MYFADVIEGTDFSQQIEQPQEEGLFWQQFTDQSFN